MVNYGGGFSVIDGGVTIFSVPSSIGGSGLVVKGLENLTTVNVPQAMNITAGGITVKGTGESTINGASLNLSGVASVTGPITIAGGDLTLFGRNGVIRENSTGSIPVIRVTGHGSTSGGNLLPGIDIQNSVSVDGGGQLVHTSNVANRVPDNVPISLNAGRITYTNFGVAGQASSINFSETLGPVTLEGGSNYIDNSMFNANSSLLKLSSLSRQAGSTVLFDSSNGAVIRVSGAANTNGILGGWAVQLAAGGLYEWATVDGSVGNEGNIIPLTSYVTGASGWISTNNVKITSNYTINGNTINSINFQNTGANTLSISGGNALAINSGGLLSSRAGHVINGNGILTAGAGGGYSLNAIVANSVLSINSVIANSGANAVSLVKSGGGTLSLSPTSNRSTNYTSGNPVVTVNAGVSNLYVGAAVSGGSIPAGTYITAIDPATNQVTLSRAPSSLGANVGINYGVSNIFTGKVYLNEGTLEISRENALGANPGAFTADQLYLSGGRLRVTQSFSFDDSNRGITIGATDGFISVVDGRKLTMGATNTIDGRLGRLIFAADSVNRGVLEIAGNNDLSGGLETSGGLTTLTNNYSTTYTEGGTTLQLQPGVVGALEVGSTVSSVDGFGIVSGSVITAIDLANNQVTISKPVTADSGTAGVNLTYGGFNAMRLTGDNTIGYIRVLGSMVDLQGNNTLLEDILVNSGTLKLGNLGSGTNEFSGVLRLTSGNVEFHSDTALTSATGYALSMNGGVVNLNGYSTTVNSLSGNGTITNNGSGASTLTVNSESSFNFAGALRDTASTSGGTLSVVKEGSGVLGLTAANNFYTGPTIIRGGVINVNNYDSGSFPSGIGASSKNPSNLVMDGGGLRFVSSETALSDRSFTLGTGANAGGIYADGTRLGAVMRVGYNSNNLSAPVAFTGIGDRTLTLGGANRGENIFDLALGDGIGGSTSLTKTGIGLWNLTSANSYSGETMVLAGTLAATVDGAFGQLGGAGVVVAGGANGSALGGLNATLDLRNVNYNTLEQLTLAGGTLATSTGNSSWAGSVLVSANSNILVEQGSKLTLTGSFAGGGTITQLGEGRLVLAGVTETTTRNNSPTTFVPSHTVQAGTLELNYTTNNSSKLSDVAALVLGGSRLGGALELVGGNHVEIVSGVTVAAGDNSISRPSGTSILRMNGISVQASGSIDFSANDIASTDTNNVNGILGGWATINKSDWAMKSTYDEAILDTGVTTGQDKLIRAFNNYTDSSVLNDWAYPTIDNSGANMNIIGPSTQENRSPNTLRFATQNAAANNMTINLVGTNTLQSGAILVSPTMGGDSAILGGLGSITAGAGVNSDLKIYQNNTAAPMVISATIANLAPAPVTTSFASGTTSITGVNIANLAPGLAVTGTGIATNTTISSITVTDPVNGIGTITLSAATNATGTSLNFTPVSNGLDKSGPGNLILTGANTYTGITTLNEGVLTVKNLSVEGFATNSVLSTIRVSTGRTATVDDTTGLTFGQLVTGSGLPAVTTQATTAASGSTTLSVGSTAGLLVGSPVTGPGVLPGTVITGIINGTQLQINNPTSASIGGSLSYGGATIASIGANNTITLTTGSTLSTTQGLTYSYGSVTPVLNGTLTSTTTNNSTTVTVLSTAGLSPGQPVSGAGIPSGAVIETIIDGTRFTMNIDANASGTNALTYGTYTPFNGSLTTTTTSASRVVMASTAGLTLGQTVSGNGIPAGATIVRIVDEHNVDLSLPVLSAGTDNATYSANVNLGGTQTATTVVGSATLTLSAPLTGVALGQKITGPGIPAGATIEAINSPTEIILSSPAIVSGTGLMTFADQTSNIGASRNAAANLVFNSGVFQYNGTSAVTDRGFTVNSDAYLDIGNPHTHLVMAGNFTTPSAEDDYSIYKLGGGTLELRGAITPNSGSYGIASLHVLDGTLRLNPTFNDQFVRSDVGSLTVGGGLWKFMERMIVVPLRQCSARYELQRVHRKSK
ncbi:MAG: autotransporter-associated beta strand repeat-containing protein [Verrucomicrobiaceae bacterium]|nr:autotransporter-associated beta strand repeat-containing protein [Verrucomicrobiaceae bacterium]